MTTIEQQGESLVSPIARAKRLEKIRNMANLSRVELCESLNLSINTYKSWETGRFGGISAKGASQIVNQVGQSGVITSIEWLLSGQGLGPYIIPNFSTENTHTDQHSARDIIIKEIVYLNTFYPNLVYAEITDDGMAPEYLEGDIVAGIKLSQQDLIPLINKECIVFTNDGRILLRYLKVGSKENHYNLCCTNVKTTVQKPIEYDVIVDSAAEVVRKYRKVLL